MKGRLVSNTGPIIALSSIDHLDLLKRIFEEVIVPEPVHHEIMRGGKDSAGLGIYRKAAWIKVESLADPIELFSGHSSIRKKPQLFTLLGRKALI